MVSPILSQIRLDRHSPVPIYRQLQQQLARLVVNGVWRAQEPLPSDNALSEAFQISVMTVRQAMSRLVHDGLIFRERGRGTFVSPRPLDHHVQRLEGFSEDMRARGLAHASQVLTFGVVPAPAAVATTLTLDVQTPVLHVRRLRWVEDRPVALHDAYLSRTDLTRHGLDAAGSLYALLESSGVQLLEADETLEAIIADRETAALLQIDRGAPLLKASRLTWDRSSTPIEFVQAVYRPDFYRYSVRLRR